jgi:hypothetical protein
MVERRSDAFLAAAPASRSRCFAEEQREQRKKQRGFPLLFSSSNFREPRISAKYESTLAVNSATTAKNSESGLRRPENRPSAPA